ncbi:ABC transporter substrate-binding protein [Actinokineospora sp. UTMC 2448]|uniref:ABC transporter substrate-binding protein n=1 Tax=Actinokineospora sp. UTMC 2448 TaxID=2268449 RepID=UPI0021648ED3|nr:extracellular solute-binding protein [Actinokineospora sp. UTMC 2448]UVS81548.1 putative arabinose-binding protein precursor [Actinokineospora sp. UTMC 2448]
MRRAGRTRAAAGLLIGGLVLTACSGGGDQGSGGDPNAPVTLTVNVFGDNFSLPDDRSLYDEYERLHPNVKIIENRSDFGTHHQNLQARLTAGTGAADLELIEVGQVAGYVGQTDKFVNFRDQGVDTAAWTDATLARASTPDGSALIGLPTDIGGLAMCYRADLFKAAGLPTDRDEVSRLWPTWEDYVATGDRFLSKAPDKARWFDAGGHVFTGVLGNEKETFYNANGDLIVAENPAVKAAWDLTARAIKSGQSAALPEFTPEWNTGFQQGQFATITCPAWMMGYIKSNAADTEGKWDIARIPGGSGNWGGSYVTVPSQGRNTAAAVELAKWLTAPEQAVKLFQKIGNFPSQRGTWEQPEVKDFSAPFFNNAPAGEIFPASLADAPVQVVGPQSGVIGSTFAVALNSVEQGGDPDEAWAKAMSDIEAAAGTG